MGGAKIEESKQNVIILSNIKIDKVNKKLVIKEGLTLNLKCQFKINDNRTLFMVKLNDRMENENQITNDMLTLGNVKIYHSGRYLCYSEKEDTDNENNLYEYVDVNVESTEGIEI